METKAKFKYNGGNPILLCSECGKVIKYFSEFNVNEVNACKGKEYLKPQFCDEKCLKNNLLGRNLIKAKNFIKLYKPFEIEDDFSNKNGDNLIVVKTLNGKIINVLK